MKVQIRRAIQCPHDFEQGERGERVVVIEKGDVVALQPAPGCDGIAGNAEVLRETAPSESVCPVGRTASDDPPHSAWAGPIGHAEFPILVGLRKYRIEHCPQIGDGRAVDRYDDADPRRKMRTATCAAGPSSLASGSHFAIHWA